MTTFANNGKLKLFIIVGTRPEIIRLAAVINECRRYFDCLLAHTGQNCSGTEKSDHGLSLIYLNNFNLYERQSDKAQCRL